MPSALISALIPIQSSTEGVCAPNCGSVWKCISDLRGQSGRTSVILTSRLAPALACVYQISPATDARHIVINPLICSVHTRTHTGSHLVWSLVHHNPVHWRGRGGCPQIKLGVRWLLFCVVSWTTGAHISGATLVRVLCQLYVGPHCPGRPLLR